VALGAADNRAKSGEATVERTRLVEVNFDQLIAPDGTPHSPQPDGILILNLFEDVTHTAVLERVDSNPGGGFTWLGHLQDVPWSQVTLVVHEGVMVGNVISPEGIFQVRYAGEGIHAVSEIDQSAFPPEMDPVPVVLEADEQDRATDSLAVDDGSIIDVLVVYTDDARWAAGGTTPMRNLITLAVAETNTSYENSGIIQRLNLVHMAEVSYSETGDMLAALKHLQNSSDGTLDSVHALRNSYYADEVVMIVENGGGSCGIAYLMSNVSATFAPWAFAVVDRGCATGYYTFGHELGHNMGARHDGYVDSETTPYPYSHGYVNVPGRWRTIMAYNTECSDWGVYCYRLQYWSNPGRTYGGNPMGTATADNHRTLNDTRVTVANFRAGAQIPNAPSDLSVVPFSKTRIDLAWSDNSPDETGFKIERSLTGAAGSWNEIGVVGANTTSYADEGLQAGTTYFYRVRATNGLRESAYSNVAYAATLIVGPLVYDMHVVDDDSAGESLGNGDGRAHCGERIELYVDLRNQGSLAAEGVTASISTSDPYVQWLYNTSSTYGGILAGVSGTNVDDFDAEISADTPHAHQIRFDLSVTANNGGPWSDSFSVRVYCADEFVYLPVISQGYTSGLDAQ
jgi:hypothetical protein